MLLGQTWVRRTRLGAVQQNKMTISFLEKEVKINYKYSRKK